MRGCINVADSTRRRRGDTSEEDREIRLLAIDDDRAYLRFLHMVLRRARIEDVLAESGRAGIDILRTQPDINLVILDLRMPDMDGLETLRQIRAEFPRRFFYFMMLTADATRETKLRALDHGFDDFIAKTESVDEITAKVRSALRRIALERRLAQENEQLRALASTDDLTGIANRRGIRAAASALAESGQPFAVLLFDLDRFKQINDSFGHDVGDQVLQSVSDCLREKTRFGDVIGRWGGDEFVVLLPDTSRRSAESIAARISRAVSSRAWHTDRGLVVARCSVGLTAGATSLDDALVQCDRLLYRAKRPKNEGKGRTPTPRRARPLSE